MSLRNAIKEIERPKRRKIKMKRKSKGDVYWYLPNKKRPIAYSTTAVSDLIVMIAQTQATIQDVYDNYIDRGIGQTIAHDLFK